MYMLLQNLDSSGQTNWATHVKRVLYENGFGYICLANEVGNAKMFMFLFKNRLKDCALQKLQAQMDSSPKAKYYREYKTLLRQEFFNKMIFGSADSNF